MSWSLTIRHLDVGQGDATLIAVEKDGKVVRTVLVDGGQDKSDSDYIYNLYTKRYPKHPLDAVVLSHYDKDHFHGIRFLIDKYAKKGNIFKGTMLFDRGPEHSDKNDLNYLKKTINALDSSTIHWVTRHVQPNSAEKWIEENLEELFKHTEKDEEHGRIFSDLHPGELKDEESKFSIRQTYEKYKKKRSETKNDKKEVPWNARGADWMLGKDLLWYTEDKDGNEKSNKYYENGAPTMKCIMVNGLFKKGKKLKIAHIEGHGERAENGNSIALIIEFNQFRYYLGGDLEIDQEKELIPIISAKSTSSDYPPLSAFKVSHHGSSHSTPEEFLKDLKPTVAFISCGTSNSFKHPHPAVADNLEKYVKNYFITEPVPLPNDVEGPKITDKAICCSSKSYQRTKNALRISASQSKNKVSSGDRFTVNYSKRKIKRVKIKDNHKIQVIEKRRYLKKRY